MTQLADALGGLFKRMATLEGRQDVVGFGVGQQLRREYSLGVGRGHEEIPFSASEAVRESRNPDTPAWDPPDAWSMKGYDNVEILPVLEPVLNEAPPSQREAAEIYLESLRTGRHVDELAREHGLEPVNVRNNFKALSKKYRA